MSRLIILAVAFALVGCLFMSVSATEELRAEDTSAITDNEQNRAELSGRQILIKTQLVEVSLTKMRRLGFEMSTFDGQAVHVFTGDELISGLGIVSGPYVGMMEALMKNSIARVLTEATIAAVDRHPASMSCGSTIKVNYPPTADAEGETKFIGTKLDVVPQVVDNDRLYVELRLDWRGIDDAVNVDETATPRVRYHGIDTTIEATFGETFMLSGCVGNVRNGDQTEETAVVLMVTPEWVDEEQQSSVQVSQVPPSNLKK